MIFEGLRLRVPSERQRVEGRGIKRPIHTIGLVAGATLLALAAWLRLGPIPDGLLEDDGRESTLVVDRNGQPLYEALSEDGTRAMTIAADEIPAWLVRATLAAEDRRYESHVGVDPIAIMRALKVNLAERRIVEGGSTISQQTAKLLLNRREPGRVRGWREKLREAVLALRLEHRFTKRELLALYLNLASYGGQIVGVERASRTYFGVPAKMLTPAQAALLAGLPQRPSGFNPYRNVKAATARQRSVLRRMAAAGGLSQEDLQQALDERLSFVNARSPFKAPHFVEMVLRDAGAARQTRIETTIDSALQADIGGIVESHRAELERHGAANVAVVVLHNATGEWLAWEGSGDYGDGARGGAINGPRVPRQPGSALKPFTYALAFERGFTPATVLADVPSHFPTAEAGVVYSPRNYDGRYRGPLLARQALAGSQNVPAVALASELGIPDLLRFLSRAGLTTFDKNAAFYGLGMTLGNAEVRLDELVAAYAAFARGGEWIQPAYLRTRGAAREHYTLVSPQTAFWIADILSDNDAREYAFGRGSSLELPFPVAVKTGTSQAYHDNWTIGFSRDVTVGVWVGNFDRTPLRNSSGVTGAAPIFHAVMLAATRHVATAGEFSSEPVLARPSTMHEHEVCALSGMAANAWCPTRRREWLPAESAPLPCHWHHLTDEGVLLVWPPEYRAWAAADAHKAQARPRLATASPVGSPAVSKRRPEVPNDSFALARRSFSEGGAFVPFATFDAGSLRIANPPDGATYLIDATLRRDFQTLSLRAVTSSSGPIEWRINGDVIGSAAASEVLAWSLVPGHHRVEATDSSGAVAAATIVVR